MPLAVILGYGLQYWHDFVSDPSDSVLFRASEQSVACNNGSTHSVERVQLNSLHNLAQSLQTYLKFRNRVLHCVFCCIQRIRHFIFDVQRKVHSLFLSRSHAIPLKRVIFSTELLFKERKLCFVLPIAVLSEC